MIEGKFFFFQLGNELRGFFFLCRAGRDGNGCFFMFFFLM